MARKYPHPPVSHEVDYKTKPVFGPKSKRRAAPPPPPKVHLPEEQGETPPADAVTPTDETTDPTSAPDEQPEEQPEQPRRKVRKVSAASLAEWRKAKAHAAAALDSALPGSTFLLAVEPMGEPPTVVVGVSGKELTPRQTQHLRAGFQHLVQMYGRGPSTAFTADDMPTATASQASDE